jgi:hypothetical protein
MDITASNGSFFVAMMRLGDWQSEWNKDKTLSVWSTGKGGNSIHIQTGRGDYLEGLDEDGKVIWEGGGGNWCWLPLTKKPIKLRFKKLPQPELTKAQMDKARKIVTRCLVSDSSYSLKVPDNLAGAIEWMQAKLKEIPKAARDSATIDFGTRHEYGESYENIKIEYREPETDEELIWRLSVEAEEARVATLRKKAEYEKLKRELAAG